MLITEMELLQYDEEQHTAPQANQLIYGEHTIRVGVENGQRHDDTTDQQTDC